MGANQYRAVAEPERRPLRVLRVLSHLGTAGTERQALEITAAINAAPHLGVHVDVATFCGPPGHTHVLSPPPGCRWHRLDQSWSPHGMVRAAHQLATLLPGYDCVHALLWPAVWVVALARRPDVPMVASIHSSALSGGPWGLKQQVDRLAIRHVRWLVFNSEAGRERLLEYFGVPSHRTAVIGNGKAPYHGPWPTRRGISCLARVAAPKRHDLLLEALTRIPADRRPILTCAGEGTHEPAFAHRLAAVGAVGAGELEHPLPLLAASELAVLPTDHEGLPNAVLDAWNTKTPVLASRVPGVEDLVIDGMDGILVDNEAHAWADAIVKTMDNPVLRERLAIAGRDRLEREFSQTGVAERWCRIYWQATSE